jgi:hypothetical protein
MAAHQRMQLLQMQQQAQQQQGQQQQQQLRQTLAMAGSAGLECPSTLTTGHPIASTTVIARDASMVRNICSGATAAKVMCSCKGASRLALVLASTMQQIAVSAGCILTTAAAFATSFTCRWVRQLQGAAPAGQRL